MVDISELGSEPDRKQTLPAFDKPSSRHSAAGVFKADKTIDEFRLRDSMGELSKVDRAIKGIMDDNRFGDSSVLAKQIERITNPFKRNIAGIGFVDKQAQEFQKLQKSPFGAALGDYHKSKDHMREVFRAKLFADDLSKILSDLPYAKEKIAKLDNSLKDRSVFFEAPPPLRLPPILPNPIHETNAHLSDVSEKIDALVDLQAKQAGLIDKLLELQITNEATQERSDKRSYRLGVINTFLASALAVVAIIVTVVLAA
jgi:hypothetical protein